MENLYELLKVQASENDQEAKRQEIIKSHYQEASERYNLVVNQMIAYNLYQFFIVSVLPEYIKKQTHNSKSILDAEEIKNTSFNFTLFIRRDQSGEFKILKLENGVHILFNNLVVYSEFLSHLYSIFKDCKKYIETDSAIFIVNRLTIGDIIDAYYRELQGFLHNEKLITSVQEEENVNIDTIKLARVIDDK